MLLNRIEYHSLILKELIDLSAHTFAKCNAIRRNQASHILISASSIFVARVGGPKEIPLGF